jgi:hypothetical protein
VAIAAALAEPIRAVKSASVAELALAASVVDLVLEASMVAGALEASTAVVVSMAAVDTGKTEFDEQRDRLASDRWPVFAWKGRRFG